MSAESKYVGITPFVVLKNMLERCLKDIVQLVPKALIRMHKYAHAPRGSFLNLQVFLDSI